MTTSTKRKLKITEPVEVTSVEAELEDNFEAVYDSEKQQVHITLTNGKEVILNSPKAKQFLLLESFVKSTLDEYKTDSFVVLKLASVCITKYGDKSSVTFDELLEDLEIEDLERIVAGLTFFRDKLEYLTKRATDI